MSDRPSVSSRANSSLSDENARSRPSGDSEEVIDGAVPEPGVPGTWKVLRRLRSRTKRPCALPAPGSRNCLVTVNATKQPLPEIAGETASRSLLAFDLPKSRLASVVQPTPRSRTTASISPLLSPSPRRRTRDLQSRRCRHWRREPQLAANRRGSRDKFRDAVAGETPSSDWCSPARCPAACGLAFASPARCDRGQTQSHPVVKPSAVVEDRPRGVGAAEKRADRVG